jgi:hypothetical protein
VKVGGLLKTRGDCAVIILVHPSILLSSLSDCHCQLPAVVVVVGTLPRTVHSYSYELLALTLTP